MEKEAFEFKPDYSKITAPALAFFADHHFDRLLAEAAQAGRKNDLDTINQAKKWRQGQINRFKREVKKGEVVELADTEHFCFIQRQGEVVRAMQSFLNSH
ncbi:MAG TPA: hypothetical protein VGO59_03850 [Verrucomicrobiae bacterium]